MRAARGASKNAALMASPRKPALLFIFITLVLDILGIGIVVPVLPKLISEFQGGDASLGSITYVGNHGGEILRGGSTSVDVEPEVARYAQQVRAFAKDVWTDDHLRLRIREEDKDAIVAFHWRGVPDEDAAAGAIRDIARRAQEHGLATHWGRKVLEVRPPVEMTKGVGIRRLVEALDLDVALFAGDDRTDVDAFDTWYEHVVLWDAGQKKIAGAYRLARGAPVLAAQGLKGLYTASLFDYADDALPRRTGVALPRDRQRPHAQRHGTRPPCGAPRRTDRGPRLMPHVRSFVRSRFWPIRRSAAGCCPRCSP